MGGLKDKMPKGGKRAGRAPAVEFGRLYEDDITGFRGKCTGFVRYISGCDQVLLQPGLDKDGKLQKGEWYDDDRLIDVEVQERVERTSRRGSDAPAPVR